MGCGQPDQGGLLPEAGRRRRSRRRVLGGHGEQQNVRRGCWCRGFGCGIRMGWMVGIVQVEGGKGAGMRCLLPAIPLLATSLVFLPAPTCMHARTRAPAGTPSATPQPATLCAAGSQWRWAWRAAWPPSTPTPRSAPTCCSACPRPLAGELAAELRARDPRHALLSGRAANRTRIAHGFAAGGGDAGGRGGLLAERVCCDLSVASQTRVPAGEGSGG